VIKKSLGTISSNTYMHTYICKYCEELGIKREFRSLQALAGHIRMAHKDVDKFRRRRKSNEKKFLEFLKAITEVDNLTYEEIARKMNTTVKNAKRIHEWGKRKGYGKIVKFVIDGRKMNKV